MKLKSSYPLDTGIIRRQLVDIISDILEAGSCYDFTPYHPDHDELFWTVDSGNDWKVKFFHDDPYSFRLTYRYANHGWGGGKEAALAGWLKVRLGVEGVKE